MMDQITQYWPAAIVVLIVLAFFLGKENEKKKKPPAPIEKDTIDEVIEKEAEVCAKEPDEAKRAVRIHSAMQRVRGIPRKRA
jgi:hypothetical protein